MSFPPESTKQTYSYSTSSSTTRKTQIGPSGETQEEFSESSQSSGNAPPPDFDSHFQRMGLGGFSSGFPPNSALAGPEFEDMRMAPMSPLSITTLRNSPLRSSPQPPAYTVSSPSSTLRSNASTTQRATASPLLNAQPENHQGDTMSNANGSSHAFKSELFIPVKQHQNTFDDFHMNRWLEHNDSAVDTQFHMQRDDWQQRLDDLKRDFFKFSPNSGEAAAISSNSTIKQKPSTISIGPSGKPEFSVQFDVKSFKPEEINVSTKNGKLVVTANHEEKVGNSTSRREVKRQVDIPSEAQIGLMRSMLSRDGVLSVTAPIKPPNYLPAGSAVSNTQITQQHSRALQSVPVSAMSPMGSDAVTTGKALDWTVNISGFKPQEVNVTVQGRKVMVHACHDEQTGGKKCHNEMRKEFTLPDSVNSDHIRSFIRNGDTLHIEASLRSDLVGRIDLVPVNYKRNL